MKFVPIDEVEKEEPGFTFVPLEAAPEPEEKVTGVKEKVKKGESVLAGTKLEPGAAPAPTETFKLPGFEHLYPSEVSPFDQSEQARTERLIMKGLDPEVARATARRNIAEGKPSTGEEFGIARPLTKAEELGMELQYKPTTTGIEDTAQVLKRAGVKAVTGTAQAGGGMKKFIGEMLDLDTSDTEKTLDDINAFTQSMGEAPNKPVQLVEGAFQSIGQQLPALVAGAATGSQALVLGSMFANSFGQTYDESRRKNLDPADATARSAAYAAFEVLGEKLGLGDRLTALKKLASGVAEKDLAEFFAKALLKEIPGEEITYTGQFATDKLFGLNSEAGIKDFIQGAVDTMLVTAIQGGVLLGGGMAMNQAAQKLAGAKREPEAVEKTSAELTQEKGFSFVPREQAKVETKAPVEEVPAETKPSLLDTLREKYNSDVDRVSQLFTGLKEKFVGAKVPETDEFNTLVNRYRDLGLTYNEAIAEARKDYVEAGRGDELDTGAGQPSISVPSEQLGTPAGAPAAVGTGVGGVGAPTDTTAGREADKQGALGETKPGFKGTQEPVRAEIQTAQGMPLVLEREFQGKYAIKDTEGNRLGAISYRPDNLGGFVVSGVEVAPEARRQGIATAVYDFLENNVIGQPFTQAGGQSEAGRAFREARETKPVTQGKPRGRPKAQLTPEEAAAKKQAKAAQVKEWKATNKTLAEASAVLDETAPERGNFESQDAYLDASMQYRARRIQALDTLHATSVGPKRATKLGQTAKEALNHPSVTEQERAGIKERYDLKKGVARSELLEATNNEENPEYNKFKTAANALSWIAKTGNDFESTLAKRILPFVRNMRVVIVRSPADLPTNYLRKQFEGAAGMYSNGVIYLDANGGMNNTVFLHEALHGATIDRINKYLDDIAEGREPEASLAEAVEELNAVMKSANRMYTALSQLGMTDARVDALARAQAFTDIKEFIAYGMSQPAMQEFLLQAPGMYSGAKSSWVDKLFTPFVQAIRKMFNMGEKHNSAMQDLILVTDKLLSAKFTKPQVTKQEAALAKKQTEKIDADVEKLRLSKSSTETEKLLSSMISEHGFDAMRDLLDARFDAMGNNFISKLLYNMPTSDIVRWKGDEIPAIASVDTMMQEMSSMRMRLMTGVAKKAETLAKFITKNGSEALSDAMHLARLKKVSPTKYATADEYIQNDPLVNKYDQLIADPNTDPAAIPAYEGQRTQRINQINAVYAKWNALGKQKGGHEMYKMVQEYYQDMYNLNRKLLDEQISKLPIDDAAKAKLMKSVRLMRERSVSNKEAETVTLDDGTESIEVTFSTLPEDYFPFLRRGQYWLNVQGPKGREFYMFESGVDRNTFKAKRAREMGVNKNDPDIFSQGDDIHALRGAFQGESQMLQEMFKAIDEADTSQTAGNFAEDLKDQLYQVYLMTMPERSFRKQFLHAEKITGFSSDILRNLKDSGTKYSNQLAKLKYGVDLRGEIQRARDSLEGRPTDERGRLELFINEMAARVEDEINPPADSPLVNGINQLTYLMLLTSAATAGVQMLSIPNMVMPTLADQYGYGKSTAMLGKYMSIWKSMGVTDIDPDTGETTFTAPSFVSSEVARNNENLRRAYQYAIDHYNMFSLTNTSILTGAAKTPSSVGESAGRRGVQTVYRVITALLNGTERISREMAFGMTFELEYAKTGDFEGSVQKAVATTQELLGRYDAPQRPRSWRGPIGKTVGQFKMYAAFMTSWFLRNGYTAIRISVPLKERVSAIHKLTGVVLMGAMFHGIVGSPLYSTIASLIDLYDWLFGDEEELRQRKLKNPLTAYDSDLRFRYEFLPKYFGNTVIPGLDGRDHKLSDVLEKGPASVLTDMNIGSRTSYDGMWFRDWKQGATFKETTINMLAANLGPSISVGGNMLSGVDDLADGKIQRGLEKFAPAFFKAPLVASRLGTEGARSASGDMLLRKSEISDGNIIAQALGFQPTRLTRIQEYAFKMSQEDKKATSERQSLLKKLNEAVSSGAEPDKFKSIFKDIAKHNRRYPHEAYEIDDDVIEKSLENYSNRKELTVRGLYIPETKEDILFPGVRAVRPLK